MVGARVQLTLTGNSPARFRYLRDRQFVAVKVAASNLDLAGNFDNVLRRQIEPVDDFDRVAVQEGE